MKTIFRTPKKSKIMKDMMAATKAPTKMLNTTMFNNKIYKITELIAKP